MPELETELPIGMERSTLGKSLVNGPLHVSNYQREYSWTRKRVEKLFDDFALAMRKHQASYFMGTIVLTPGRPPNIIDGQQRLATTSIFLAAVRDALLTLGRDGAAKTIESDYLFSNDIEKDERIPRLSLNTDDRAYMMSRVLEREEQREPRDARFTSHKRIDAAATVAADRVQTIISESNSKAGKVAALNAWIEFIRERAVVVHLMPPNRARAYQIFKTQNDRAQQTTPADMIKSHLFEQTHPDTDEAQSKWSSMRSTIEGLTGAEEDPLLTYLHHVSIVLNGPVKADDIFEHIEDNVIGKTKSLKFLEALASLAGDYEAILTPSHPKWSKHDQRVKKYVERISIGIRMSFIRPLMLSIAAKFTPAETRKTYQMLVSWVVRFLIAGGSRSGVVEKAFGEAATAIYKGRITTANDLAAAAVRVVPNDVKFRAAFVTKSLSSSRQARFFLRELESQVRSGSGDDLLEPIDDVSELTLEHILPKNPAPMPGWSHFSPDARKAYRNRLGNYALLKSVDNGAIGDKPFAVKKPIIAQSAHLKLTADIITRTDPNQDWTAQHINHRQEWMAELAMKRWPLVPSKARKIKKK